MGQQSSVAPSPLSTGLATAVRVLLARRGLQQKDLTRVAGRSGAYWSKRLNGQLGFTLLDVERLADGFGVGPEELMHVLILTDGYDNPSSPLIGTP